MKMTKRYIHPQEQPTREAMGRARQAVDEAAREALGQARARQDSDSDHDKDRPGRDSFGDSAVGGMGKTIRVGNYGVDYGPHTFHIRETEESRAVLHRLRRNPTAEFFLATVQGRNQRGLLLPRQQDPAQQRRNKGQHAGREVRESSCFLVLFASIRVLASGRWTDDGSQVLIDHFEE